MSAQTVLQELTGDQLTHDHVRQRVDDWCQRLEALYDDIGQWLPPGWTAKRGPAVTMNEELMQSTGEPARELPTLELHRDGSAEWTLRPQGLWIIGVNGRIDLVRVKDLKIYLVLDLAKTFEPPDWHIEALTARGNAKRFDRGQLKALLAP